MMILKALKEINMKIDKWILLLMLGMPLLSFAQEGLPKVKELAQLDVEAYHLMFVSDDRILFTNSNFKGLKILDISSGDINEISNEKGSGYDPRVTGSDVLLRSSSDKDFFEKVSLNSGEKQRISAKEMFELDLKKHNQESSGNTSELVLAQATADLMAIELRYADGSVKQIQPDIKGDYLSISLSPDKSKILFRVSGKGSYISDLSGKIQSDFGNVEFPKWLNDSQIIYTITNDDGYQFISSQLFVVDSKTLMKRALTREDQMIVLYPSINADGSRLVFNDPEGKAYLMTLEF